MCYLLTIIRLNNSGRVAIACVTVIRTESAHGPGGHKGREVTRTLALLHDRHGGGAFHLLTIQAHGG